MVFSISILGAGISGLSLAWYLSKEFPSAKITVYEKEKRCGGLIATRDEGRFFFEKGPRTFSAGRCPELLHLIEEMGLKDKLIYAKPARRYIYYRGALRTMQTMAMRALMRGAWRDFKRPVVEDDESVHAFSKRRFGQWCADYLFDPLTLGIYGGNAKELSMNACFPCMKKAEKTHGSLIKGMRKRPKGDTRLFTLSDGMEELIERLLERTSMEIKQAEEMEDADLMFDTTPRPDLVDYEGMCVVHLGYEQSVLRHQGFGYLIPSIYQNPVLGIVFDSCIFPQQNRSAEETRLTVMLRLCDDPLEKALAAVRNHLGILSLPFEALVSSYSQAIPQMKLGHQIPKTDNVILAGNYIKGPAVNSCVRQAKELACQASLQVDSSALQSAVCTS